MSDESRRRRAQMAAAQPGDGPARLSRPGPGRSRLLSPRFLRVRGVAPAWLLVPLLFAPVAAPLVSDARPFDRPSGRQADFSETIPTEALAAEIGFVPSIPTVLRPSHERDATDGRHRHGAVPVGPVSNGLEGVPARPSASDAVWSTVVIRARPWRCCTPSTGPPLSADAS